MKLWIVVVVLLALVLAGVGFFVLRKPKPGPEPEPADEAGAWFEDVTARVGVDFVHEAGDPSRFWQPQIHGSGVALFDYDGDGRLDLYLLNFGGENPKATNRLYRNKPDGTFEDVSVASGLGIPGHNTGVAIGDVNNDGWPDVLVTQYLAVKLFLNNGNGTFRDATEASGLKNPLWGTSASFFDYDRDGFLDLVVVNYLEDEPGHRCYNPRQKQDYCGPTHFPPTVSKLFRNLGLADKGHSPKGVAASVRFQETTLAAGMAKSPGPGLAVFTADFSGDGWPDILIVNDNAPNFLWINQKNGKFKEDALLRGIAVDSMGNAQAGMGVAIGDVDGDGLFDVYMTHLNTERNTLWKQVPKRGEFADLTAQAGLLGSDWRGTGFGTLMADCDQDGWPDIAVANGGVTQGSSTPNPALGEHYSQHGERNQLFRNEGKGKFRDLSKKNRALCGTPNVARGKATGDLDGDGALDLVVTNVAGKPLILKNVAPDRGHWLIVRALDPRLNRDAYGPEIQLRAGGRNLLPLINPSDSFQSSSDPRAHFGLGQPARYDDIHVLWPDGLAEVFSGGVADRSIVLRRGEGKAENRP